MRKRWPKTPNIWNCLWLPTNWDAIKRSSPSVGPLSCPLPTPLLSLTTNRGPIDSLVTEERERQLRSDRSDNCRSALSGVTRTQGLWWHSIDAGDSLKASLRADRSQIDRKSDWRNWENIREQAIVQKTPTQQLCGRHSSRRAAANRWVKHLRSHE